MKKFLQTISFTLLITLVLSFFLNSLIFDFFYRFHKRTKVDVYNCDAAVAFFGSSRCVNSVVPEVFTKETGLTSVNIGWSSSNLREIYAAVKIYLIRNKKPKYIFVQIDKQGLDTGINKLGSQPLLKFFNRGIVDEYFSEDLSEKLSIPLYASIYYRDFGWREVLKTLFRNSNNSFMNRGYAPIYGSALKNSNQTRFFKYAATDCFLNQWLKAISDLCQEKDIKLVLFTAPYLHCNNGVGFMKVEEFKDFKYLNLSDCIQDPGMFFDFDHLNDRGAKEFSHKLGELSKSLP